MVFADEDSPVYMMGGFDLMAAMLENQPKVQAAFKSGGGVAWGEQAGCMFCAVARFFRPGYHNNLVSPVAAGARRRGGEAGARRQGCRCRLRPRLVDRADGQGVPEVAVRRLRLPSRTRSRDAQAHADEHGVTANTRFEVGLAKDYPGKDFDLVTCFDCLHDMGDPAGAAAHIRQSLKPDGTWMIVEPMAGDALRAEPQSGRAAVLRRLDHDLRADLAVAGSRHRARRAGRRGEAARGDHGRRLHAAFGARRRRRST